MSQMWNQAILNILVVRSEFKLGVCNLWLLDHMQFLRDMQSYHRECFTNILIHVHRASVYQAVFNNLGCGHVFPMQAAMFVH